MLNKLYNGATATYRNTGTDPIPGGSLVPFGGMCGVALEDIPAGEKGPLELSGVFSYRLDEALAAPRALGDPIYLPPDTVFSDGGDLTFEPGGVMVGYLAAAVNAGAVLVSVAVAPTPAAASALAAVAALASRVSQNETDIATIMAGGEESIQGASAYQLWLAAGNEGTLEDFLASLKGDRGDPGADGADGQDGAPGDPGKSAYQIWLDLGNEGTKAKFIASLKGAPGADGAKGEQGVQGPAGQTGPQGAKGDTGLSAYQHWLAQGWQGTVQDFLNSLKGAKGDTGSPGTDGTDGTDGLSAYQLWLAAGHEGTVQDFLDSLKGEVEEAPQNGKPYVRKDGHWVEAQSGGGSSPSATDWTTASGDTQQSAAIGGGGQGEGIDPTLMPSASFPEIDASPTGWTVGAPDTTANGTAA